MSRKTQRSSYLNAIEISFRTYEYIRKWTSRQSCKERNRTVKSSIKKLCFISFYKEKDQRICFK